MTRAERNLAYYDRTRRKTHAGKLTPVCRQRGPVGSVVTCKTCLMALKARAVGSKINEWEQKRLDAMFRKRTAERSAAWRRRNPEKARLSGLRWREKNRDVIRVLNIQWQQKNRAYRNAYNARWRANRALKLAAA